MYVDFNEPVWLPGGVRAGVERMNGNDIIHQAALGSAIEYDAIAHHAHVDPKALQKILRAAKDKEVEAWFVVVGGKIAGASVEYATVQTVWDKDKNKFVYYPAIYGEDTSVFAEQSKDFRSRTKWGEDPNGIGLGTWFEKERIRHWTQNAQADAPLGLKPVARIGEYSPHSAAMIKIFTKLGARLGTEDHGILELDGRDANPSGLCTVRVKPITSHGKKLDRVFAANWSSVDGAQQIDATFTKGISTFTGDLVVRVQIMSNGNLPGKAELKDIMASLLQSGQHEIDEVYKWGIPKADHKHASPIIRPDGNRKDVQISRLSIAEQELVQPHTQATVLPVSLMRVHSFEKNILDAIPGQPRMLGPHAMRPVAVTFGV